MATYRPIETYKQIGLDDKVDIRDGAQLHVIKKDGVLPDGRALPQREDQTKEEWQTYVDNKIAEIIDDTTQTTQQVRDRLNKLLALPDALKTQEQWRRFHYMSEVNRIVEFKLKEFETRKTFMRADDYERVIAGIKLELQANDATRLHKLQEEKVVGPNDLGTTDWSHFYWEHTFVVRHNWLAVLGDTNPELDEWELPFDYCMFEFRVGGFTIIVNVSQETNSKSFRYFIEVERGVWYSPRCEFAVTRYVQQQRAAACVVLEAQVATKELVRQPAALNAKRERSGKVKISDYHVIDLARRRPRIKNVEDRPSEPKHQKRLHFCRGHWRHLPDRKVRIPWCLKGNPALGFVDKLYKL